MASIPSTASTTMTTQAGPADAHRGLRFLPFLLSLMLAIGCQTAHAWGDEGHKIVGQIATHYLEPDVRAKIDTMLAADTSTLTAYDFVS